MDDPASRAVPTPASAPRQVADLLRVLGNLNAVPVDLTSMMMEKVFWLIVSSFSVAFIVTVVAGPVVTVVACAGLLIVIHAEARGVWSMFFVFIVTAAAGPVVAVVGCAGVLIYALAEVLGGAVSRAEAAEADAEAKAGAAEAAIAEAEAVVAAARLRLLGGAAS